MSKTELIKEWTSEAGLLRLEGWAREGKKDGEIAREMGISASTLGRWRKKEPSIGEALDRGREPVDVKAENTLLRAALGYTVTVRKPFKLKEIEVRPGGGRTEQEHIEYAEEEVHVPARMTALVYWLKNRRPDRWRDKPQAEAGGGDDPLDALLKHWGEEP